jgi:hypothetical protein
MKLCEITGDDAPIEAALLQMLINKGERVMHFATVKSPGGYQDEYQGVITGVSVMPNRDMALVRISISPGVSLSRHTTAHISPQHMPATSLVQVGDEWRLSTNSWSTNSEYLKWVDLQTGRSRD